MLFSGTPTSDTSVSSSLVHQDSGASEDKPESDVCGVSPDCLQGFHWAREKGINETKDCNQGAALFRIGCEALVHEHEERQLEEVLWERWASGG